MVKSGPLSSVCLRKPSKERCFEVRMTRPGEQWLEKATKSTVRKRPTPSLSQEPRARPIRSVLAHRQMPDAPRPSLQGREGGPDSARINRQREVETMAQAPALNQAAAGATLSPLVVPHGPVMPLLAGDGWVEGATLAVIAHLLRS